MSDEQRGSAAVVLLAVAAIAALLGLVVADVGVLLEARSRAESAADAAALAAAPVTFRPFGALGTPRREAAAFASANGATLKRCVCERDASFEPRDVVVEVGVWANSLLLGDREVVATGRARFDPTKLGLGEGPRQLVPSAPRRGHRGDGLGRP